MPLHLVFQPPKNLWRFSLDLKTAEFSPTGRTILFSHRSQWLGLEGAEVFGRALDTSMNGECPHPKERVGGEMEERKVLEADLLIRRKRPSPPQEFLKVRQPPPN